VAEGRNTYDGEPGTELSSVYDAAGSVMRFIELSADSATVKLVANHYGRIFNVLEIIDTSADDGPYAALAKTAGIGSGIASTTVVANIAASSYGGGATFLAKSLYKAGAVLVGIGVEGAVTDGLMLVYEPSAFGANNVDGYVYDSETDQWYDHVQDPYILDYSESVPAPPELRVELDAIRDFRLNTTVYVDRAGNQFAIDERGSFSVLRPDDVRIDIDQQAIFVTDPAGIRTGYYRNEQGHLQKGVIDSDGEFIPGTLQNADESELVERLVIDVVEISVPTDDAYYYPEFTAVYQDGAGNSYGIRDDGEIAVFKTPESPEEAPRDVVVPADEGYPLDNYVVRDDSPTEKPFQNLTREDDPAAESASPGDIIRAHLSSSLLSKRGISEDTIATLDTFELVAIYAVEKLGHPNGFNGDEAPLPDYAIEVGQLYQNFKEQGYSTQFSIRSAREGAFAYDATEGPFDELPDRHVIGAENLPSGVSDWDDGDLYVDPDKSSTEWTPPAQYLPPSSGTPATYLVEPGDSLWSIAEETGIPFQDVLDANQHLGDPNLIQPGDVLNLSRDIPEERFVDGDLWDATEGPPGTYGGYDPFSAINFDSAEPTGDDAYAPILDADLWDATETPADTAVWYPDAFDPTEDSDGIVLHSSESDGAVDAFYGSLSSAYGLYSSIESGDASNGAHVSITNPPLPSASAA